MNISDSIFLKLKNLNVFKRDGKRAPHKPLLLLFALGKMLNKNERLIPFAEIDTEFKKVLASFSPWGNCRPVYPFWYLQNDDLWELKDNQGFKITKSGEPSRGELLEECAEGGLPSDIYDSLKNDKVLFKQVVETILTDNFPATIHEDILQAVGIDMDFSRTATRQQRDFNFRDKILKAYEYKCAICGFDVRLGNQPIALEAAHIKWVQAGGPCIEENGLALCAMHHKLFDRGAFSISEEMKIMVSDEANGTLGFNEWLMNFHKQEIRKPQKIISYPKSEFVVWHIREVFRGEYRT